MLELEDVVCFVFVAAKPYLLRMYGSNFAGKNCLRSPNNGDYRYGLNGIEKVDEMHGNSGDFYAADYRSYDARLGRWLSQDPIVKPWESPYAGFANNPIFYTDPTGLDPVPVAYVLNITRLLDALSNDIVKFDKLIDENTKNIEKTKQDVERINAKINLINILCERHPILKKISPHLIGALNNSAYALELRLIEWQNATNELIAQRNSAVDYYNLWYAQLEYSLQHATYLIGTPQILPSGNAIVPIYYQIFESDKPKNLQEFLSYYSKTGYSFTMHGWEYMYGGKPSKQNTYNYDIKQRRTKIDVNPVPLPPNPERIGTDGSSRAPQGARSSPTNTPDQVAQPADPSPHESNPSGVRAPEEPIAPSFPNPR